MTQYGSYKEEIETVRHIIERYQIYMSLLSYLRQASYYPGVTNEIHEVHTRGYEHYLNNQIYKQTMIEQRVRQIDSSFKMIGPEYAQIIRKEFLEEDCGWWMDYYGRSTYYRHKKKAVKAFLAAVDELVLLG